MLELLIYSQFCKLQAHFELEQFDSDQVCLFNQVEETRLGGGQSVDPPRKVTMGGKLIPSIQFHQLNLSDDFRLNFRPSVMKGHL